MNKNHMGYIFLQISKWKKRKRKQRIHIWQNDGVYFKLLTPAHVLIDLTIWNGFHASICGICFLSFIYYFRNSVIIILGYLSELKYLLHLIIFNAMLKLKGMEEAYLKYRVFGSVLTNTLSLLINLLCFFFKVYLSWANIFMVLSWWLHSHFRYVSQVTSVCGTMFFVFVSLWSWEWPWVENGSWPKDTLEL